MSTNPKVERAAPGERLPHIDVQRGIALFAVLMVNLENGFRLPLLECILRHDAGPGYADHIVEQLVSGVLEFVVFAIGTAAILVPEFVAFGLPLPSGHGAASLIAQAREAYGHGGYLTIIRFRWHEIGL
jgi:hypothetical protein